MQEQELLHIIVDYITERSQKTEAVMGLPLMKQSICIPTDKIFESENVANMGEPWLGTEYTYNRALCRRPYCFRNTHFRKIKERMFLVLHCLAQVYL